MSLFPSCSVVFGIHITGKITGVSLSKSNSTAYWHRRHRKISEIVISQIAVICLTLLQVFFSKSAHTTNILMY